MSITKGTYESLDLAEHHLALRGQLEFSPLTGKYLGVLADVVVTNPALDGSPVSLVDAPFDRIDLDPIVEGGIVATDSDSLDTRAAIVKEITWALDSGRRHRANAFALYEGNDGDDESTDFLSGFSFSDRP